MVSHLPSEWSRTTSPTFFKGITGERKVRLDVVVEEEPDRKYRRIRYEGPPAGLQTIVDIVRDTART